ncbi:MAG: multidrug efflux RND transporter permease subunit [Candidatus Hydrogenedentes bacterium]|nr:multidrug efflux RND transporter permease subunit [Candidatus Hydrogenedentota bacterium]
MLAKFFIDRPVFAAVISIVITICGAVSILFLPVEQSPEITPPTVVIEANYPGADAETVSESIATPIEQELSGIENLIYYQSTATNTGRLSVVCTFDIGADLDIAAVEVQNRLKRAEPRLPQEVIRQGLSVNKRANNILGVVALNAADGKVDDLYLANYATINLLDALKRVPGVGDVQVFGGKDYSMRIWLNPDDLASKGLTISDVAKSIREQNSLFAAGRVGAAPNDGEVAFTIPVITQGRLSDPEEYKDIILRANEDGSVLRLGDVARVELGSLSYDSFGRYNAQPAVPILIFLQPGANALSTLIGVKDAMEVLKADFPEGVTYSIPFDITRFIDSSISEVVKTLLEAAFLVVLVVFVFLGSWRATLIPLLAVPVSIIGTFLGMYAFGFSINTLTLFGLVLAIGIVVDDAILVVENVERVLHEGNLSRREATIKATQQIFGAVVASVLVLLAVYLPVAFLSGLTGAMYRQFAITISVSVAISGLVALSLSPALCRIMLRANHQKWAPFRAFDWCFDKGRQVYVVVVRQAIRFGYITIALFIGLVYLTYLLFGRVPGGFVPQEDQGYFIIAVQLPQGSALNRTEAVVKEIESFVLEQPEVEHMVALVGLDFLSGFVPNTNGAVMFVNLKNWEDRPGPEHHVDSLVGRMFGRFGGNKDALILALNPPAIRGLGVRAGFEMQLEGRGVGNVEQLTEVSQGFMAALGADPRLQFLNSTINMGQPRIFVDVDRTRAKAMGLPMTEIFDSLQAYLGSLYVNDFTKFGRVYRVQVQAESEYRQNPDDIRRIYARNDQGHMVELSGVLDLKYKAGPNLVTRFNSYPSVQITGVPAPGYSTGDAIKIIEELAAQNLPDGYGFSWSGASYQEVRAGNQAPYVLAFGLVMVFLVLAAQYEKWSLPLAVLLAVPFGLFGAIFAVFIFGMPKDIYFQVGLLTLVGLAAKNAILIVEFAAHEHREGKGVVEAALEAARLRLRPILMTSLAFVLGVLPLAISSGAGAAGRQSIGIGILGGMISATFLAVVFVPLFFVVIQAVTDKLSRKSADAEEASPAQEAH